MLITKKSMLTGKTHTMELDITPEQWEIWNSPNPPYVQVLFHNLGADEREFLLSGSTQEEWDLYMKEE